MGREVRMVHKDWVHPTDENTLRLKPLHEHYRDTKKNFEELQAKEGLQAALDDYGVAPNEEEYMPEWDDSEKTHFMMYENTSEGTGLSPAMETPEELAQWLVDNNISTLGRNNPTTYENWLYTCKGGYAPSMVIDNGIMKSGVDALAEQ